MGHTMTIGTEKLEVTNITSHNFSAEKLFSVQRSSVSDYALGTQPLSTGTVRAYAALNLHGSGSREQLHAFSVSPEREH